MSPSRRPTPAQLHILRQLCEPGVYLRISESVKYGGWADVWDSNGYYVNVNLSTARALAARRDWLEAAPPPAPSAPSYSTYRITDAGRAEVARHEGDPMMNRKPSATQLSILARLCESGAYLQVMYGWANSAHVGKDDGPYYHRVTWGTMHALTSETRGWLNADVDPKIPWSNITIYRITDAGRAAVGAAQKQEGGGKR